MTSCNGFTCNNSGTACHTFCNAGNNTGCETGYYCAGPNGTCTAQLGPGSPCTSSEECLSGMCATPDGGTDAGADAGAGQVCE
jgi:hypothetical protein